MYTASPFNSIPLLLNKETAIIPAVSSADPSFYKILQCKESSYNQESPSPWRVNHVSPWHRSVWNPVDSTYQKYLQTLGFKYPSHSHKGLNYTNVHGNQAKINPNYPIGLIVYSPIKIEQYYQTTEQASLHLPHSGHWQVMNMITGEIMIEPNFS
jgi:hypothetical protein